MIREKNWFIRGKTWDRLWHNPDGSVEVHGCGITHQKKIRREGLEFEEDRCRKN